MPAMRQQADGGDVWAGSVTCGVGVKRCDYAAASAAIMALAASSGSGVKT
jgi:hypothetical protein